MATPVFSNKHEFLGLLATESDIKGLESVMKVVALQNPHTSRLSTKTVQFSSLPCRPRNQAPQLILRIAV